MFQGPALRPLFNPFCLHKRWVGIHIVVYIYDGLGEGPSYPVALDHSTRVKTDLIRSGFVPYLEKSVWVPTSALDCLGFPIDLFQGFLFVQGIKLKRVLSDIDSLLEANCCTARELSVLAGRINSFKLAVGYVTTVDDKVYSYVHRPSV